MKVPFIKYIEALVVCKYSFDHIKQRIFDLNMVLSDSITDEILEIVYQELYKEQPEYFAYSKNKIPDYEWIRKREIEQLVAYELKLDIPQGTKGVVGSLEIIKDKDMFITMTALALAHVNNEDIELICNGKYNIHYAPEDFYVFLHYFFNVEKWSLSDKRKHVEMVDDEVMNEFYNIAIEGDKPYLIWKLGLSPTRSFSEMLQEMGTDAYFKFKEKMDLDSDQALKWGAFMTKVSERAEKLSKDTKDKKSLFEEINFVISNNTSSSIKNSENEEVPEPFTNKDKEKSSILHISELDNGGIRSDTEDFG